MDKLTPKMEAHGATVTSTTVASPTASPKDPFRLGYRLRFVTAPDGQEVLERVPLTLEDLVYPEEGDQVSQGLPHCSFLHSQCDVMRRHLEKRPGLVVTSDVVLVLRHDGRNSSPDIAVIEGRFDTTKIRAGIHLKAVGGRLVFVLEAVSTSSEDVEQKDLRDNLQRYAREGVEEYFTVYPVLERKVKNLVGRRLVQGRYVEIPPDDEKRVLSEKLGLFFQIDRGTESLVMVDAVTGERLLFSDEEEAGRKKAEERAEQAEKRAEQAEERAEWGLRRKIEDLCGLLDIEWTEERSTLTAGMKEQHLEELWEGLMSERAWPATRHS